MLFSGYLIFLNSGVILFLYCYFNVSNLVQLDPRPAQVPFVLDKRMKV